MNRHELIDVATIRLSALLLGESTFFARSVDAPPLVDVTSETTLPVDEVGDPRTAGRCDVEVDTPCGVFETAYLPWQWLGPEYPTLVYHHGSGERPFDSGRFSTNSVRRLFCGLEEDLPINLIAVRAPFHDGSSREYIRAMGELENFVGMLAASAGLLEALTDRIADRTDGPVVLSGISLGGWVVNLHRACFGSADRYVPLFAGAALGDMFVSSVYRYMTADAARRRPSQLREVLDFEDAFRAVEAANCAPLLGRYDRIIEYDRQRPSYTGMSLAVLERGHVTGSLAAAPLRQHVLGAIPGMDDETVDF
ncbi:hypothetical protein EGH23_17565 [Halomicroarcula sp. F27]|uniref:Peptidase S9 prolyl oligopeptidase catalytic domain-containing protein n=1 Tax=Haloarcula nitratireducens TaxID=2487749 RepID=A0AAW4PFK4_9EURY|nr:hypothetical protein [Halomicroarcula nitratireducens]